LCIRDRISTSPKTESILTQPIQASPKVGRLLTATASAVISRLQASTVRPALSSPALATAS
ncbi:MAG: hypothetical protein K2M77_03455, partial [Muribaculaceae bacterium]|nr:hypothetical protein [Muribaculaceae bacterium]